MRTATLILLFASLGVFAAPQDSAKPKPETAPRFEAIPASVAAGQTAQLTWTVEGATSVTIEPVVGNVPAVGSAPVTPGETTTYTLTAVVPSGTIRATATVTVGPAGAQPGAPEVRIPGAATTAEGAAPKRPAADIDPARLAAPPDTTTKPQAAPVDEHAFILGAEDQISIVVYGSPEFSGSHMIRPDGKITLNFIGEVMAAGVTPEQLSGVIKERIKKYVVDPDVSTSVLVVKSKRYFIQGEVNKTGEFPLVVPTRVLEALVNAGGFRDFANKKNIIVLRGTERLKFNYNEVIKGKHMEQNIYLKAGDIILVR